MENIVEKAIKAIESIDKKKYQLLHQYQTILRDEDQTVKTVRLTREKYNALRFSVDYSRLTRELKACKNLIVKNDDETCDKVKTCFLYGGANEIKNFQLPPELEEFVRHVWVDCNILTLYGTRENPNDYRSFVSDIYDPEGDVEIYDTVQDDWGNVRMDIDIIDGKHKDFLKKFPVDCIDDFINQEWEGINWELFDNNGAVFSATGAPIKVLVAYFGVRKEP